MHIFIVRAKSVKNHTIDELMRKLARIPRVPQRSTPGRPTTQQGQHSKNSRSLIFHSPYLYRSALAPSSIRPLRLPRSIKDYPAAAPGEKESDLDDLLRLVPC